MKKFKLFLVVILVLSFTSAAEAAFGITLSNDTEDKWFYVVWWIGCPWDTYGGEANIMGGFLRPGASHKSRAIYGEESLSKDGRSGVFIRWENKRTDEVRRSYNIIAMNDLKEVFSTPISKSSEGGCNTILRDIDENRMLK